MEIDVFIPSISLGLEFQGQHHYHFNYMFGDPSTYKSKDKSKKEACEAVGMTNTIVHLPNCTARDYTDRNSILVGSYKGEFNSYHS
jgi:hypothetical protein